MNIERNYTGEYNSSQRSTARRTRNNRSRKGRYLSNNRTYARRRRRKLNPRFMIFVTILLALLIGIVLGVRSCTKPTLKGRWDLDGTTGYEFKKGGKGALVLVTKEYEFTYEVEDDKLSIDFIDEMALDAQYTFEINGRMLFLTGGPGDAKSEYVLHKLR